MQLTPVAAAVTNLTQITTRLHSSLQSLTVGDDHTQYGLLAGRSGGQTLIGDTASAGNLLLKPTSHATLGYVGVPYAPRATANHPLLAVGSGAFDGVTAGFFVGSANGTLIGGNAASGFSGNPIDLQIAGAAKLKVDSTGAFTSTVTAGNYLTVQSSDSTGRCILGGTGGAVGTRFYPGLQMWCVGGAGVQSELVTVADADTGSTAVMAMVAKMNGAALATRPLMTFSNHTTEVYRIRANGSLLWPVAPPATANYGLVSLGSGPFDGTTAGFFVGSASGTVLAGNAATGFAGNLIDFRLAGAARFSVTSGGALTAVTLTSTSSLSVGSLKVMEIVSPNNTIRLGEAAQGFSFAPAAVTSSTASTEFTSLNVATTHSVQFATGALALNRAMRVQAPTYAFVGASTLTEPVTLDIDGCPVAGTNATFTGASALRIKAAPFASSKMGLVSLGSGPWDGATAGFFAGSASGTVIAVNAASGFGGNLMELQVAGSSKFRFTNGGALINFDTLKCNKLDLGYSNGSLASFTDAVDLGFGTTTGSKLGTATTQKISLWNATPIVQPTTAVAQATHAAVGGAAINVNDTYDGYSIGQIVKALRNFGLLA